MTKEELLKKIKEGYWQALQGASQELREDREVVLAAVQQDVMALEFASEELQGDRDVVLAAISNAKNTLDLMIIASFFKNTEELKKDSQVMLALVAQMASWYQQADESLKQDKNFILEAVAQNGKVLEYVSE